MTGVLLVNMGGATSLMEMKNFLARMFKDPCILPYGKTGRFLLSFLISKLRYKRSWKKYQLIGGSPVIESTKLYMQRLQDKLGDSFKVKLAFSYTKPLIKESLESFDKEDIKDIVVIPLYPQASYSTTSSVERDVNTFKSKTDNIKIRFIKEFYNNDGFIEFWSQLIHKHIDTVSYNNPHLLFSAHSIPKYLVDQGDTYPATVEESANLIAKKLGYDFDFAYQSSMKRGKWIGPEVKNKLRDLAAKGKNEIIIIPISFVSENLETLYDIDLQLIAFGKNELGIQHLSRVRIPEVDELFIQLLADIVRT